MRMQGGGRVYTWGWGKLEPRGGGGGGGGFPTVSAKYL